MRCASCGFESEAGNRFCEECGALLASTCPSCGEPTRAGARFCRACGNALTDARAPSAAPAMSAPSTAERRLVTVLFTDLVGFTSLAEDRDPETVRELLSRYFATATEIIGMHGGTVEKFIGDAVMAVWGTPTAHEDDAERAVRAAMEMIDAVRGLSPNLQARAGVLTGEAAVTIGAQNQGMVAGDLVNTAARLQGVAEPGTVLVGEATMRSAERAIVFESVGDHSLRGKVSPVPAWQALRVVAQRGGQGRGDALEPPFVGRDEELRQLKEALHTVGRERRARLVSITGPGGIGKSRLAWELEKYVDGVTEKVYWHRGRSPSYGEGITFWALGEMVRRRAKLTEDDDEAATRSRVAATLDEYVPDASERERIGPALLSLLGIETAPAGGRDALFPAWRLLFERIAEEGALATIVARAEGVPLYAVETVRGLLADGLIERQGGAYVPVGDLSSLRVPESLRSLIASRLDALDPADRALLQDAAVLGQVFTADALAAVSGTPVDGLEPRLRALVRRELLDVERDPGSPERGQYKFVQSLIREVAYGTLARRDRRARHLAVARHYEGMGDPELAGALANHYLAAREASEEGPEADALAAQARLALSAAAERAAALGSPEQAVRYLEQALEVTSDLDDRAALFDRAAAAAGAAASPQAQRHAADAISAYLELGDRGAVAAARARLGRILLNASEIGRATEVLEQALAEAEAVSDEAAAAATLANLSRAHMRSGRGDQSVEAADRALAIAERLNLEETLVEGLANRGAALAVLGRRREAVALLRGALKLAQELGLAGLEMRVRNNLASALSEDDPVEATRIVLEAMDLARQIGDRRNFNWLVGTAAMGLVGQGRDWDQHVALLQEALGSATLRGDRLRLRALIGLFEAVRGEGLEELRRDVTELVADSTGVEDLFVLHTTAASTALATGDAEAAYERAMAAYALRTQSPDMALAMALEAVILSGDPARARRVAAEIEQLPATGARAQATRRYAAAVLAALEGRRADAVDAFRDARLQMTALGARFEAAAQAAEAVELMPDEPEVRGWAAEARPLLEELRARPLLGRLDAALASPGTDAVATASGHAAEPSVREP